jgi:SAM-dependent methyltransferase
MSFQSFNPKAKSVVLKCLSAPGIDYQSLWKPWFSLLMCDPDMAAFQALVHGEDVEAQALFAALKQPFLIAGLCNLICFDPEFEQVIKRLYEMREAGESLPKDFIKALAVYCEQVEYVFCAEAGEASLYPVDETIKVLSAPEAGVSSEVVAQYQVNPYPRWTSCNVITSSPQQAASTHRHLIAGCGTGYGACMTAQMYPAAEIIAIDISLPSLSYAKRKANALKHHNINFYQADILNLERLDGEFDVIECSGVLHHMEDPIEGWKCLLEKLAANGRMHIGLYSEIARADVVAAREFIAAGGYAADHAGIATGRAAILALPEGHAARGVLDRRDFYSASGCRDLIFHVQEHRFTIVQLSDALAALGLCFDGFSLEDPKIAAAYRRIYPDDPKMQNLENWAVFEVQNPDAFRGMYQFWCSRDSR